jgi:putative heme-binding domain-containing protein
MNAIFDRCGSPVTGALVLTLGILGWTASSWGADPFAEGVRPTPWLKPEEEQARFKLPPGFEIQLVAAEPDINKPLNLAFDATGRLWVTTSIEYPYAAPTNRPARDRLMIFDDFGPDGRARKVTEFAGGLNIPIGVYPFLSRNPDGRSTWKAVVWSIPNIWLFEDSDGDNKADRRQVLYGPFDHTRDTHGNQASFRRGFDGWLYATHGYNNDSHVKGRDGRQIDLNSGNTYRLQLDGSRLVHHTHGQVNPFGLAFDQFGNLFSSDCHSEPLYQLLVDGYYPSFGKPHDGLGFAPTMMERMRGSTAIDGVSHYADDLWPAEYRGDFFFGDVMASRVMRDRATEAGATIVSKAAPDFVATEDPWFRPVDTTIGPDGAMYIADFYNKIIGHYEVPLTHPGRDRTSGRIWRVVYKEKPTRSIGLPSDLKGLVRELGSPNLSRRMLAMNTLEDQFGKDALKELEDAVVVPANPEQQVHALWVLHRLGGMEPSMLTTAARSPSRIVRVHVQRIARDIFHRDSLGGDASDPRNDIHHIAAAHEVMTLGLKDPDALVVRCAAEAASLMRVKDSSQLVRALLDIRSRILTNDTHLRYVVRKSIRDQLRVPGVLGKVLGESLSSSDEQVLADVAMGIPNGDAATLLLRQLPKLSAQPNPTPSIADVLKHAARYAPESELPRLVEFASQRIPAAGDGGFYPELERQFGLFLSVDDGLQQRGRGRPEAVRAWGTNLVWKFFGSLDAYHSWTALPFEPNPTETPWDTEMRNSTDGRKRRLTSSLPHGEALTGILRSPAFPFPGQLSFWLCGHDGFPNKPSGNVNMVRLRAAGSGEILATTVAPRQDVARKISWDLPDHKNRAVQVEVVDGDAGTAYAWIAFGGFEPELPPLRASQFAPRRMRDWMAAATDTAVRVQVKELAGFFGTKCVPQAGRTVDDSNSEITSMFARAWVALSAGEAVPALAKALNEGFGPSSYREALVEILATQNSSPAQSAVVTGLKALPYKTQEKLAYTMASARFSAETLLSGIESGAISPRVLQRIGVSNRLKASKPADWESRVARLTKGLTPADEARDRLIMERRQTFAATPGRISEGGLVFIKNCAPCHRLESQGSVVGPQLDGIGQRGAERLCEDILDPNRNVDRAFRSSLLTLKDGDVVSGLFRREEGELLVLADGTGKEITVSKAQVTERRESEVSLMPENFGEILSGVDFNDLMAFLMSKKAASPQEIK